MDRWACVDAFSFPLQVLLCEEPEWLAHPAAVLDKDHPQGRLMWLNQQARQARLAVGMRYGQALALVPHLRARAVEAGELVPRAEEIARTLGEFSPRVERDEERPGLFFLDASGLGKIYPEWSEWVGSMRARLLGEHGVRVVVVVGFTRFGTFAVARATGRSGVFSRPEDERRDAGAVALAKLDLGPSALELTRRLGIGTVAELMELPPESLRRRLGPQVYGLYRRARGDLREPLQSVAVRELPATVESLDHEEGNRERLLFLLKRSVHGLLAELEEAGEKLVVLEITLGRRGAAALEVEVQPATPTVDAVLLMDLVRLRLESLELSPGVSEVAMRARGERTVKEQLHLFAEAPRRDPAAANRALARLRAEFGDESVCRVVPAEGHLPERRFELVPTIRVEAPATSTEPVPAVAVRRFFPTPQLLTGPPRAQRAAGPHVLCGGWWVREVHREYHLVETGDHRLLWVFYDHVRKRWYLHGEF